MRRPAGLVLMAVGAMVMGMGVRTIPMAMRAVVVRMGLGAMPILIDVRLMLVFGRAVVVALGAMITVMVEPAISLALSAGFVLVGAVLVVASAGLLFVVELAMLMAVRAMVVGAARGGGPAFLMAVRAVMVGRGGVGAGAREDPR